MLADRRRGRDLTLTTNGSLLASKARALADAGLRRVTVSLDSLDERTSRDSTTSTSRSRQVVGGHRRGCRRPAWRPSRSTWSCAEASTRTSVLPMARYFREQRAHPALHRVHGRGPHQRLAAGRRRTGGRDRRLHRRGDAPRCRCRANYPGEVAERWRYRDGSGEVGVIASVTQPFCASVHACPSHRRRPALHVPLRRARPRPPRAPAVGQQRRGHRRPHPVGLARSHDRYSELRSLRHVSTFPRSRCRTSAGRARCSSSGARAARWVSQACNTAVCFLGTCTIAAGDGPRPAGRMMGRSGSTRAAWVPNAGVGERA